MPHLPSPATVMGHASAHNSSQRRSGKSKIEVTSQVNFWSGTLLYDAPCVYTVAVRASGPWKVSLLLSFPSAVGLRTKELLNSVKLYEYPGALEEHLPAPLLRSPPSSRRQHHEAGERQDSFGWSAPIEWSHRPCFGDISY